MTYFKRLFKNPNNCNISRTIYINNLKFQVRQAAFLPNNQESTRNRNPSKTRSNKETFVEQHDILE